MMDRQQSLTYHSLHRHVQSIMPQHESKGYSTIYSSNKQPRLPSILQMSRQKKSHEKSLKKGISRVSKSKKDLMENTNTQTKEIDTGKSMSKGTLLNFNIQQVVQNRYHLTRPKDQIIHKSPIKIKEQQRIQKGPFGSNEKSFISQYRIVTYVPSGYEDYKNSQSLDKLDNPITSKQFFLDKQNNLNGSNLQNNNHKKNDSEQIHIRNPVNQPILELETWRTSSNFDPYYTNNFNTDMTKSNFIKNQKPYSFFQQKYSIPLTVNMEEISEKNSNAQGLKDKVKHLEHEIVDIERQKTSLIKENKEFNKENEDLKKENEDLKKEKEQLDGQHKKMSQKLECLYLTISSLQEKVRVQDGEIENYVQQLRLISKTSQKLSNSELYQEQQVKGSQKKKQIQSLQAKISQLQITNATLSRELSEKSLSLNELNRSNRELSERLCEMEKVVKRSDDKLQDKQIDLLRKDQQINELVREIEILQQSFNNERNQMTQNYHSLPINQSQSQNTDYKLVKHQWQELKQEFQELNEKYEQKVRDYNHLQKKHNFMKDQLEHLKYLQTNGAASYRSLSSNHYQAKSYESNQLPNDTKSQYEQFITGLQTRLEITERNLKEMEDEYSNLKQNFRALEELYIKQQQQNDQIQHQLTNFSQENKKLKIQLANQEEVFKAKTIKLKEENECIKLMEKEEIIINLKRELNSLERYKLEIEDSQSYLQQELQQLNEKYLKEVEKSTQFAIRYKEDLCLFTQDIKKQQEEKTSLIVQNYENLISKLNQQLTFLKDQVQSMKDKSLKELLRIEDLHTKELQQLKSERFQKQYTHEQVGAKRQLQKFNLRLQQECRILETKCKKLEMQKQIFENDLVQNISKMNLYEQEISYYKDQKGKSMEQKLELSNELEKVNQMILQFRKLNCSLEEQRLVADKKLEECSMKYIVCMKQNEVLMENVKCLTIKLSEKQNQIDNIDVSLRELKISLLEEKQNNQKKLNVIESLKAQYENHRSKEEYYKMMYENTSQQLELSKQQISALLLQNQRKSIKSSPIKELQTMKKSFFNDYVIKSDNKKDRETQLYRIEVYKDLNQLLNLTLQNFTLQQLLQQNEQEYLRKLFNAIKEDHDKLLELKQLIFDMEEGFRREKVHIKEDYDLVYDKYLKYKSMCQAMEKDIERYKLKLKKKEDNYA